MKLFEAIKASPVKAAIRHLRDLGQGHDGREPNIVLMDEKHKPSLPKAFRSLEDYAWERRPLAEAKRLTDWAPAENRFSPETEHPLIQLARQAEDENPEAS